MLHSFPELLREYELKGFNFNKRYAVNLSLVGNYPESVFSISTHRYSDLEKIDSTIQYAFLSPIYDSHSKKTHKSKFQDRKLLTEKVHSYKTKLNIIALGGVDYTNVEESYSYGFDGVALIGYLWRPVLKNKDIDKTVSRFLKLKQICSTLDHTSSVLPGSTQAVEQEF